MSPVCGIFLFKICVLFKTMFFSFFVVVHCVGKLVFLSLWFTATEEFSFGAVVHSDIAFFCWRTGSLQHINFPLSLCFTATKGISLCCSGSLHNKNFLCSSGSLQQKNLSFVAVVHGAIDISHLFKTKTISPKNGFVPQIGMKTMKKCKFEKYNCS